MAIPFGKPWPKPSQTAADRMSPVSDAILDEIALTRAEYEAIVDRLGREPGPLELGLFGALWSEHCGYKHTKALLRTLPNTSDRLLVEPGAENAGVVDIGDGYAIAFKIESHNHPSAVEPVQGAATGVGGIVRDILAMGARPVALLNSLRFGDPSSERTRHLFSGVIEGISAYGNCIGVPNVGGEIEFHEPYESNPLVNVMCVGIIEGRHVMSAKAEAPGDMLVIVGAKTGRDGIHGASGLASRTFDDDAEMRPAVQVGNPFMEKVLIEACLEAAKLPCVVGMQDCGAAGLTSAAVEMAERSGMGVRIDVTDVPQRESGMNAYEVMLSESQERMLLAVKPDDNDALFTLFDEWDLDASVIGEFRRGDDVEVAYADNTQCMSPVSILTDAPEYSFDPPEPLHQALEQGFDPPTNLRLPISHEDAILDMLRLPNIASKRNVWRRYDHQVQNNTVAGPGGDAAVIRIQGTNKALAMSTDGNSRWVRANPFVGAAAAVAEACRNVSCVGATPIALTDGLNFGNPEIPMVQYQLQESIAGIRDAATAFGVPIISGNASLYNESESEESRILPTPIVGAVGLLEDVTKAIGPAFQNEGDRILLLGSDAVWDTPAGGGASEALQRFHKMTMGNITIDLELEAHVQALCREMIDSRLINSANDCSIGGLMVAVAESCMMGGIGAIIDGQEPLFETGWLWQLFGETQSRILVSVDEDLLAGVTKLADGQGVPWVEVGVVGGDMISVENEDISIPVYVAEQIWQTGLDYALGNDIAVAEPEDATQARLAREFFGRTEQN